MPTFPPIATPEHIRRADDQCSVKTAFEWISQGDSLVFDGTYNNARQLLAALARHIDTRTRKRKPAAAPGPRDAFNRYRQQQSQRTSLLNRVLVEVEPGYRLVLGKAPDVSAACLAAFTPLTQSALLPLRQILGAVSAWEWRKKGINIDGLDQPLSVHYGVFSPIRGEYLNLIRTAPLPSGPIPVAVDLGTGTGVIAALLAQRGIQHVIATDTNPDAIACAAENFERLGLTDRVTLLPADTFPPGKFKLIVCNPPWLPGRPTSALESAIYDPESQMTRHFLHALGQHLDTGGEGWLIMSDLAERLQLRDAGTLEAWIDAEGLRVIEKHDTQPTHPRTRDASDALHQARAAEITCLWRLTKG